ncbi:class I SAM-dependent methyltransferase [Sphaerisporangium krabiense]|uniref:Phospholipid N-methyltransferase n=1 Tax=Sphaerisporangium krabiense TaxID=763782 RepID=A0A7W8YZH1_9ACTN|nr:methyltransferase domain-containing protein [Sphaerisporangium krabiense]MBB5624664.1 phospholipid N-methyltransferase [Sphaerisporangium krabiense]
MSGTVRLRPAGAPEGASDLRAFMKVALRRWGVVGAVAPSSAVLARALTTVVPAMGTPVVVELGPGTGPVSEGVRARMAPGGRHIAIEIDPSMVAHLRRVRPWLEVIHGDAADLGALLEAAGAGRADAVVSTLPWSLFPGERQARMLAEIGRVLAPGGAFTTVNYLPAMPLAGARAFRARLRAAFDEVLATGPVWRNVPPGVVYVCRRPAGGVPRRAAVSG